MNAMNAIQKNRATPFANLCRAFAATLVVTAASVPAIELTSLAGSAAATSLADKSTGAALAQLAAEKEFDVAVRDSLVAARRYPALKDVNRPAPQGKATVVFGIGRDGKVTDAAVVESSRNRQLDAAALAMVRRAPHRPIPVEAIGETSRRYLVTINFSYNANP